MRAPRGNAKGKGSDAQSRVESGEELTHEAARTRGKQKRPAQKSTKKGKVRVAMLGGLGEIGKNIAVIESGNDIIVVDCGLGFPDDDMLGVDLVIPDVSYLEKNEEKVRGIFITHGHEDHIGALPYVLRNLHVPVYATRLTLGVLERTLSELQDNFVKVQVAFADNKLVYPQNFAILHEERQNRLFTLVVKGSAEKVEAAFEQFDPVFINILPLSLEEVFFYELGGVNHEIFAD